MQLSKKRKIICYFFFEFSKFRFDFQHFLKKDDPHSRCIFELTDFQKGGYINHQEVPFQRSRQVTW